MRRNYPSVRRCFLFALPILFLIVPAARAQDEPPVYAQGSQGMHDAKIERVLEGARKRIVRASTQHRARPGKGQRVRQNPAEQAVTPGTPIQIRPASELGALGALAVPGNVKANDKTGDGATAGQAEQSLAMNGNYGACAWNDGQGFTSGGDTQGVGVTTDGGATWTDIGSPPHPSGAPTQCWLSDPIITLNEKTGEFWYCGILYPTSTTNGIGVVRGTFSGSTFTWGTPRIVASGSNSTVAYDKPWCAVDSLNGNLYVTYTLFTATTGDIKVQRSTDSGVTWSAAQTMNLAGSTGYVQGSRPAPGPSGEVYVVWYEIGPVDADYVKLRKSTNAGSSFASEVTAASWFTNFGTGAPGYNRNRGIDMPGIAVDRSTGSNRGRVYVTYNETFNWYDDALGGSGAKTEVESNNTSATANLFTIGNKVRGAFSSTSDLDWFKWSATAGQNYVFWVDSIPRPLYQCRIYCSDGTTQLAYTGDQSAPAGGNGFIVFTAPTTATYYLRMSYTSGGTGTGGYRIQTGLGVVNDAIHGRDSRDIMVIYSDNGTSWTGPLRVNDASALYQEWLPEVSVTAEGYAYAMWYDWRDALSYCGGRSHVYVTRSTNGGAAWEANQVATTAQTAWTTTSSNIIPNQGDYNGMYGGDGVVAMAWADGRLGDADVFTAKLAATYLPICAADTTVTVTTGTTYSFAEKIQNNNVVFSAPLNWTLTANRSWPGFPMSGSTTVAAAATGALPLTIGIPDSAANGIVQLCFTASQANGARSLSCCSNLNVFNLATAALASLVSASADAGRVRLSWALGVATPVTLYRTQDGRGWDRIATLTPDGTSRVAYEDAAVTAGQRYGYRLGIPVGGREATAGETWLDVPATAVFALHGARPNPSVGSISISFSLASGAPATLELIDLSGRRVMEREVGGLGAGFHVLPLDREMAHLPAGIYAVRLTQGGRTLTMKATLVR